MSSDYSTDLVMPVGPHAGKPMSSLDLEYLERCLQYDSSWKEHRPLFLAEIKRRRDAEVLKHRQLLEREAEQPAADKTTIQVSLPSWIVKRVKISCVVSNEKMHQFVARALERALEDQCAP